MNDAPPEHFRDLSAARDWLLKQPLDVVHVLMARAALRALPDGPSLALRQDGPRGALMFSTVCRSLAATLLASVRTEPAERHACARIYNQAEEVSMDASMEFPGAFHDLACAAFAAVAYAGCSVPADPEARGWIGLRPNGSTDQIKSDLSIAFYHEAISLAGGEFTELASRPLWPDGTPNWTRDLWEQCKAALPPGEDWEVWTDWYEARLRGDPYDLALESARVLEPTEEDWTTPKRANAKLREIIARQRQEQAERLMQDPRGGVFALLDGVLTLVEGAESFAADAMTMRPPAVAALRRLTDSLVRTDQHGDLRAIAEELLRLIDRDPDCLRRDAFALWAHSIALAEYRARDARTAAVPDPFDPPLDPARRFALDAAVPPVALYARCFDEVRRYDTELANFEGNTATPATQRAVLAAASVSGAVDTNSETIIIRVIDAGEGNDGIALRARRCGWFTMGNAVLWSAGAILTGYFGQIGIDLASRHQPLDLIERFLRSGADSIDELLHDTPADVRAAYEKVRSLLRERFENKPPKPQD